MKFGRNFHRHQVPEWAAAYINYAELKRLTKAVSSTTNDVLAALRAEIRRVDEFYIHTYTAIHRTAAAQIHGASFDLITSASFDDVDPRELEYILGVLLALQRKLKQLVWYGSVNRRGLQRIFARVSLNLGRTGDPVDDIARLSALSLTQHTRSLEDLDRIDRTIASLDHKIVQGRRPSECRSLLLEVLGRDLQTTPEVLDDVQTAILTHDHEALQRVVDQAHGHSRIWLLALHSALWRGTRSYLDDLAIWLGSLQDVKLTNGCLHSLVAKLTHECTPHIVPDGHGLLIHFLQNLQPHQRSALLNVDRCGRCPLHYIAEAGLEEACHAILGCMRSWSLHQAAPFDSPVLVPDCQGDTPLHLAIAGRHTEVTKMLLHFYTETAHQSHDQNEFYVKPLLGDLLGIAVLKDSADMVRMLLAAGADANHQALHGETPLYFAARSGNLEIVTLLLKAHAKLEIIESGHGWTPLSIACVEGHSEIVDLLLQAKADLGAQDFSGWTALDHAAFRGHIPMAKKLWSLPGASDISLRHACDYRPRVRRGTSPQHGLCYESLNGELSVQESRILVNLGSFDVRKKIGAVDLSPYTMSSHSTLPDPRFSISLSTIGAVGRADPVQLPILDDKTNVPWIVSSSSPRDVKLVFNIHRAMAESQSDETLIGRAIAMPEYLRQGLGPSRETLVRDHTIPIIEKETLRYIGTVTFSILVVGPFNHPAPPVQSKISTEQLWNEDGPTKIIGHRGAGQNIAAQKRLQIGENTIQSFHSALELGASYVECDVQLTKDHIPVIYHDFLVSETGTDAPMHTLSFEQFMHISNAQHFAHSNGDSPKQSRRSRANSDSGSHDSKILDMAERMKRTLEFKIKTFKGNTKGNHIHGPFMTLEQLLKGLAPGVPLNIEIKYPMLSEADEDWKMDLFGVEVNLFVDTILQDLFTHVGDRPISLSAFNPEICILVALKQSLYPVLFLNDSGNFPVGDTRASSLQEAMHFAERWGLDGVIMASEPLVIAPKLVRFVKAHGLTCSSYGAMNDEPRLAKIQADAGLDTIIVDHIRSISETLAA